MLSRFYTLTDHPTGLPKRELFSLESQELPDLDEGEVRIRNHWLSVDPYMRGRMSGVHTYVAPFQLGKPMEGGAIGEVIASNHPNLKVGDKVSHMAAGAISHSCREIVSPLFQITTCQTKPT